MSQSGAASSNTSNPQIPTSFVTNSGTAIPSGNVLNVLGLGELTTSGSGNTVSILEPRTAKFIVDPTQYYGTHQTIQAAINAASSGDVILIRPATYTENLTLKAGVNLCAYPTARAGIYGTSSVIIIGQLSDAGANLNCQISGLQLQTNSSYVVSLTGSSDVILQNCFVKATNNTPFNMSSGLGNIFIYEGWVDLGISGISLCNMSAGALFIYNTNLSNSGSTTTPTTLSNGSIIMVNCSVGMPFACSSTGLFQIRGCLFGNILTPYTNQTWLTINGSVNSFIDSCQIYSGTASCISIGAGATATITNCVINSSNTNAITGAGTINYSGIIFTGTSSVINTTTQAPEYTNHGKYKASGQPCFLARMNAQVTNAWGDNSTYTVIFDTSVFDQASNYAVGTGSFTAPVAGKYLFSSTVLVSNTGGATSNLDISLVATSRTIAGAQTSYAGTEINGFMNITTTFIVDMAATDTAHIVISGATAAGTKTGTIYGQAGTLATWFSGYLIC